LPAAERRMARTEDVLQLIDNAWFRSFLTYDPRPSYEAMTCPVLALFGVLDLQVPPEPNLPEMLAAFERGAHPAATVRECPGVNHLFQRAETGAPSEYAQIEETIAPEVLETIAGWITLRFVLGRN